MNNFGKFDRRYLKTVLLMSFCSQMGLSYEEGRRMLEGSFTDSTDRNDFLAALAELLKDPTLSAREKVHHYVEEPMQDEREALDFLTFIWETVTDEPWPADIPKGNGERFKPKPGHARGY